VRICMPTTSYPRFPGDFRGTLVYSLAEGLAERGHEVHIVAPYDPLVDPDPHSRVQIHRVRYIPSDRLCLIGHGHSLEADVKVKLVVYPLAVLYVIAALWEILRLHRRCGGFDVIHAHWVIPNGFVGALAGMAIRVPLIVHLHGSEVFILKYNRIVECIGMWVYGRAKRVLSCSADLLRRSLDMGLDPSKSESIPTAVDVGRFAFDRHDGQALRQHLEVPENARVILAPGRLVSRKGFEYLIEAMPAVVAEHPQAKCILVGDGDLRGALGTLADQMGISDSVAMPGEIPWNQMVGCYSAADVLVVPSVVDQAGNVDGLPNCLLEGMACGLPTVATEVAGIPEVIRDGDNGILVQPQDSAALATGITRLLDSAQERKRLGTAARATVVEEFNITHAVRRLEEIYRDIQ